MPLRAVILGKILLVRQPIAQALSALDFETFEFSDYAELVSHLDLTSPSLIVMDADGMSREWRALAAGLGARPRAAALVLVTSRFSFDDAHDAMALKVAGVIVKPFRGDQHTPRLLDLALRQVKIRARRASPRFAVPPGMNAVLRLSEPGAASAFPLKNISEGGAEVDLESARAGSLPDAGTFVPSADIIWGDVQFEAAIDVVHRDEHTAGIRFSRLFDGVPKFLRALKERHDKAAGSQGIKRKW